MVAITQQDHTAAVVVVATTAVAVVLIAKAIPWPVLVVVVDI
jgi:hypothetical protein